jgi:hypothetical protein
MLKSIHRSHVDQRHSSCLSCLHIRLELLRERRWYTGIVSKMTLAHAIDTIANFDVAHIGPFLDYCATILV